MKRFTVKLRTFDQLLIKSLEVSLILRVQESSYGESDMAKKWSMRCKDKGVDKNFLEGGSKFSEMSASMVGRPRKFWFMERLKR